MAKVYVAMYEHRHGTDVRVFDHIDKVEAWRQSIAEKYFDDAFRGDILKPDDIQELTEEYWNNVCDEWFTVEITDVE